MVESRLGDQSLTILEDRSRCLLLFERDSLQTSALSDRRLSFLPFRNEKS